MAATTYSDKKNQYDIPGREDQRDEKVMERKYLVIAIYLLQK